MTEKNYAPSEKENKLMKKQDAVKSEIAPNKINRKEKIEKKKEETQIKKPSKQKIKKDLVFVNAFSAPISAKFSMNICRFIKYKTIEQAMRELEEITNYKRALPMKGEYAHRKGRIMSGKYPQNATKYFINLLKTLQGNSNVAGIDEPVISEAFANFGPKVRARFGRWERKRANIKLTAIEKKKFIEMRKKKMGGKK